MFCRGSPPSQEGTEQWPLERQKSILRQMEHKRRGLDKVLPSAYPMCCRYQGALDYVWYEPGRMAVRREIELPGVDELVGWLPSERFPSDHLSVSHYLSIPSVVEDCVTPRESFEQSVKKPGSHCVEVRSAGGL